MNFPAVDPIPVPAPIWLLKALSLLTLALHFAAVMILVGSLVLVVAFDASGRARRDGVRLTVASVLARRLTVVMTYVINLGVPPLLFVQVLYGRAIYTSSILIGVLWIGVIGLLMIAYWLLYRTQAWIELAKPAWVPALVALLVVIAIGHIYAMNMTLMLRPEVWPAMYAASPSGLQGASSDPTMVPRWLFVMAGGMVFGGLWAMLHGGMKHLDEPVRRALVRSGGGLAAVGGLVQIACAFWVVSSQPANVQSGLAGAPLYLAGEIASVAGLVAAALVGAVGALRFARSTALAWLGLVLAFVGNAGAVIVRDGIRDLTLVPKGFDVWDRTVVSNWGVIGLFLVLFVVMLGVIGWLLSVMRRATPPREGVTP